MIATHRNGSRGASPPRVLMLNDRLSSKGGADRHLLAILDELRCRADTLLAVGFNDGSLGPGELERVGPWLRLKGLDSGGLSRRGLEGSLSGLESLAARFRPQVIHLHNIMAPELIAAAAGLGPCLMTVQDHRLFCPGAGKLKPDGSVCGEVISEDCLACFGQASYGAKLLDLTKRRLAAASGLKRVLVLSTYMKDQLEEAFAALGLRIPTITVLPPFAHGLRRPKEPVGRGYHLLACRLVESKGVRIALRARELLREPLPLLVAGDGPLAEEVGRRARESGGSLILSPWADRERMSEFLAGARSVWLPSLWAEPFGIAGLEAMAAGRPVIASRVGGVSDWLLEKKTGFLFEPGDAEALARAADMLAADSGLALAMGRAGATRVQERFNVDKLMERLAEIYEFVAG